MNLKQKFKSSETESNLVFIWLLLKDKKKGRFIDLNYANMENYLFSKLKLKILFNLFF